MAGKNKKTLHAGRNSFGAPQRGQLSSTHSFAGGSHQSSHAGGKRPPSGISHPAPKKQKLGVLRDVSLAEAGKHGTLNEFAFFDKVSYKTFFHV